MEEKGKMLGRDIDVICEPGHLLSIAHPPHSIISPDPSKTSHQLFTDSSPLHSSHCFSSTMAPRKETSKKTNADEGPFAHASSHQLGLIDIPQVPP